MNIWSLCSCFLLQYNKMAVTCRSICVKKCPSLLQKFLLFYSQRETASESDCLMNLLKNFSFLLSGWFKPTFLRFRLLSTALFNLQVPLLSALAFIKLPLVVS